MDWVELLKDNMEEAIVACNGCSKEIKNTPGIRHIFDEYKYYACSVDCKLKVKRKHQQFMKENTIKQKLNSQNKANKEAEIEE